jgi:glycosyltransferase involved in cell wall biosynthesis
LNVVVFPLEASNNPVIRIINASLVKRGVVLSDYNWFTSGLEKADLFHVHWPDAVVMGKGTLSGVIKTALFLKSILLFSFRRVPILWSVHNVRSNNQYHPLLEALLWRWFLPRVSAFHHFARWSTLLVAKQGRLSRVIPHPHYRGTLSNRLSRIEARRSLDIPSSATVILAFGQLAPYKGFDTLIRTFGTVADPSLILIICGQNQDSGFLSTLQQLASHDNRVRVIEGYLRDVELQRYNEAADLTLLPYKRVNNSGAAVFALSIGRCVLAPASGSIVDLSEELGEQWVTTYEGDLTAEDLRRAIGRATAQPENAMPAMLASDPDAVGQILSDFYSEIVKFGKPSGVR